MISNLASTLFLISLALLVPSQASSIPRPKFLEVNHDQTVREGESADLVCILQINDSSPSAFAFWENGLTKVIHSNNGTISISTTLNHTAGTVATRLSMAIVGREKSDYYRCSILITFADGKTEVISSEFRRLTVLYFLRDDADLSCQGPGNLALYEGDELSMSCIGTHCNPPINLEWAFSPSSEMNIEATFSIENVSLTGRLRADRILSGEVIACIATSTSFPGRRSNCTIGPFTVLYRPAVRVIPASGELFQPTVAEITLTCVANGNPAIDSYTWSCHPQRAVNRCDSTNKNITINLSPKWRNQSTLNITCGARNFVGASYFTSFIEVNVIPDKLLPQCRNNISSNPVIVQKPYLSFQRDVTSNTLKCFTIMEQIISVNFRWYSKGRFVGERVGVYDFEELPHGSRRLIAHDVLKEPDIGVVTCEIHVTSSINRIACVLAPTYATETLLLNASSINSTLAPVRTNSKFLTKATIGNVHKGGTENKCYLNISSTVCLVVIAVQSVVLISLLCFVLKMKQAFYTARSSSQIPVISEKSKSSSPNVTHDHATTEQSGLHLHLFRDLPTVPFRHAGGNNFRKSSVITSQEEGNYELPLVDARPFAVSTRRLSFANDECVDNRKEYCKNSSAEELNHYVSYELADSDSSKSSSASQGEINHTYFTKF